MRTGKAAVFIFWGMMLLSAKTSLGQGDFQKSSFYDALASGNLAALDEQMDIVKKSSLSQKDAFEGVLLMKKAGLVDNPKNKLSLFKSGKKKLESVINKDSTNAEFRFFRLMIQENAPKILGYHNDLEKDSQYVREFFKSLSPVVQHAIIDYAKNSKVLNITAF